MTTPKPDAKAVPAGWGRHAPSYRSEMNTLLAAIAAPGSTMHRYLAARSTDDAAIALLDSWATIADVLGFYQHRITPEGLLSTATEDRSIVELARLVGYVPQPGLAASVHLAYQVDPLTDPDTDVLIPAGSRVKGVPAPAATAQTFETSKDLTARARWSTLPVPMSQPVAITPETAKIFVAGSATALKPNDVIAVASTSDGPYLGRRVQTTQRDVHTNLIEITLQPAGAGAEHLMTLGGAEITPDHGLLIRGITFGGHFQTVSVVHCSVAPRWLDRHGEVRQSRLHAAASTHHLNVRHSIVGAIHAEEDTHVTIEDSVIDPGNNQSGGVPVSLKGGIW